MQAWRIPYAVLGVALVALAYFLWHAGNAAAPVEARRTVEIAGATLHVDVADTESLQERGLSGRSGLAPDEGMLFVFETDGEYSFWMKEMLFPIDIVWISSDGEVVFVSKNVSPVSYPASMKPDTPARYVLELPAGFADAHGVEKGTKVRL